MGAPDWRVGSDSAESAVTADGVTELSGPGWRGRFERTTFGVGFHMHLGRIEADAAFDLPVAGAADTPSVVSAFTLISGAARHTNEDWPDVELEPGKAILFVHKDRRGGFRIPGPQVLSFFSVAVSPELLTSLLDGRVPPLLAPFVESRGRVTVIKERPVSRATRSLIDALDAPGDGGALQRLHREAVAIRLLSELIEPEPEPATAPSRAETAVLAAARARLLADLHDPPPAAVLAEEAGLSLRRFLRSFEALHGASPAQLVRRERLVRARLLLEAGETPLKEIAWQVGYAHVSNFVTAFADEFGAPPRRFQRRSLAAE